MSADPGAALRDISIMLAPGVPSWPGDTPFSCGWTWKIADGASVNVSSITFSPHVGTHADTPLHVRDGWAGSHELPLEAFIGRALVVNVSEKTGDLSVDDLALPPGIPVERLLLKTGSGIAAGTFPPGWVALSPDCAKTIFTHGTKLLGVDAPSVDHRGSSTLPVHRAVFDAAGAILENLDLREIEPGWYDLFAFPMKVLGLDAAPVRAVLRDI